MKSPIQNNLHQVAKKAQTSAKTKHTRRRYDADLKKQIIQLYPLCRDTEDKIELAEKLGIESLHKLYNLASRLGVTREYDECYDSEGKWIYEGAYTPVGDLEALRTREKFDMDIFSERDDIYLQKNFGSQFIEEIRYVRNHTEIAMAYRARHLGLRKPCWFWDIRKVCRWLGLNRTELMQFAQKTNVPIYPCANERGVVVITLVSTMDLARLLVKDGFWKFLLEKRRADEFFIREIIESSIDIREGIMESSPWISHGHTNLHPFGRDMHGTFLREYDRKMVGGNYMPYQLDPRNLENLI